MPQKKSELKTKLKFIAKNPIKIKTRPTKKNKKNPDKVLSKLNNINHIYLKKNNFNLT